MRRDGGATSPTDHAAPLPDRTTMPPFVSVPSLSPPTGGGALRGIDEKFTANAATGTGTTTIAIPTSPGRSGVGPQLSLTYDSGVGNGAFGFGWTLSVPHITRGTSRGLPTYADDGDDGDADSVADIFVLSGSEDLVPELLADGSRHLDTTSAPGFAVRRYRPRVEGLFARIERWTDRVTGESHWRSISRENVVSLYGRTRESRIADPTDASRIFSWLLCETFDDRGNGIAYGYAAENASALDPMAANERNRERGANRYLERIRYGNRVSFLDADGSRPSFPTLAQLDGAGWMFEVVFDHDEDHWERVLPDPALPVAGQHVLAAAAAGPRRAWDAPERTWRLRPDPFSSYRSGFEVRTYRRCRRALVFHRFDELGPEPYLVRATHFDYRDADPAAPRTVDEEFAHQGSTPYGSFLCAVTQSGYVRDETRAPVVRDGVSYPTYIERSLPPLDLEYARPVVRETVRDMEADALENLPAGVDGAASRWVDLDGEGIAGVLAEHAGAWYYKRSLGGGRLAAMETVPTTPASTAALVDIGHPQLLDLSGDGQLDFVTLDGPTPGFHERTLDAEWEPHRAFRSLPSIAWDDPNLRMVDLDGDGRADVLITEQDALAWHQSLGEDGFGERRCARQAFDEELGPRLLFDDGAESIHLADMSGDGLTDLVRIRDGEICYWPNLGYGRFGAKVTMDDPPRLDLTGELDRRRILLADIDGSGTTDLLYLARDGVQLYFNRSGNGWSAPRRLAGFPDVDSLVYVTTVDLLGNGTACLVWSSPAPDGARRPLRYVDLMGGVKPHLLVRTVNNLGAETRVEFASSTAFYLADRAAGQPWVTRLPFPVHVVRRVTTLDHVSGNRFVSRYAYHHGHFDGAEREFRGFGMVEQWDTEELPALAAAVALDGDPPATNLDVASFSPPAYTRTWFHTGVYLGGDRVSRAYAGLLDGQDVGEYWREPAWRDDDVEAARRLLDDTILPPELDGDEAREACRALRGMVLRTETFALDGSARQDHPYVVVEQNSSVSVVQRRGPNRHAVFFAHPRETIEHHYERNPTDPRVTHSLTLDVDRYGNVRRGATIAYGRRQADPTIADARDRAEQTQLHATCVVSAFTDAVALPHACRTPLPSEARTFELTGLAPAPGSLRLSFAEVDAAVLGAAEIPFDVAPFPGASQKRVLGHVRMRYRPDDLGTAAGDPLALLPLHALEPLALPGDRWTLALTPGVVARAFDGRVDDAMLLTDGGYVHAEGDAGWWAPSGRLFYSPSGDAGAELAHARAHFFLPCRLRDPFHTAAASTEALVRYDVHDLLVEETEDALGNRVTAGERRPHPELPLLSRGNDYRVLRPRLVMDANRNRTTAASDALGMVVATAVMGKPEDAPAQGDRIDASFRADLTVAELDDFLADPIGRATALLGGATTRTLSDVTRYWREPVPSKRGPVVGASLARETHASEPVPPGGLRVQLGLTYSDGFGRELQRKTRAEAGPVPARDGAGRVVIDPDGRPVVAPGNADPRWAATGWSLLDNKGRLIRRFEPFFTDTHRFERDVRVGVGSILFRDPLGRTVGTLHADHRWEKTVHDPWRREVWDAGDTMLIADPTTDPDVGSHFARLPAAEYLPTWHARRAGGALGLHELRAATASTVHAGTFSIALLDSLGRSFTTIAHNRVRDPGAPPGTPDAEERYRTHLALDVVGNVRSLTDELGRVVARSEHDLLGNRLQQATMEGGTRWLLADVAGATIHVWDARGHHVQTTHDRLHRPRESRLRVGPGAPTLIGRIDYGEGEAEAEAANLRGRIARAFDQAGMIANEQFDFRGNLVATRRRIVDDYRATIDWSGPVPLLAEAYVARTRYDALGRPTQVVSPHADLPGTPVSTTQPTFNVAGLLETLDVWLDLGAEPPGPLAPATATLRAVRGAEYDAMGRRTLVETGAGGTDITYTYDPTSLQLTRIHARRPAGAFPADCPPPDPAWPGCDVQDLRLTYDPLGNVIRVGDEAQQAIWFRNRRVEPSADFAYDALARLVEATGREHLGGIGGAPTAHSHDDVPRVRLPHRGDALAMGRYRERYAYDAAGNIASMTHLGTDPSSPGWRRTFVHDEPSALEPGRQSNRLTRCTLNAAGTRVEQYSVGGDGYDPHGNMLRLPQLQELVWDHADRLRMTRRQAVDPADAEGVARQGERTWYVYDASGNRVRKVTESAAGQPREERLYLGGVEVYRRHGPNVLARETLHIMDDERRVALVETRRAGSEAGVPARLVRYQLENPLGSVSAELDEQGRVVSYEEYSPYGSTTYQATGAATDAPKRYRHTGKERDEESGFYYHGARYYAPWLARWTSADPAGPAREPNLYVYVRANPVTTHDPDGAEQAPSRAQVERWIRTHPEQAAALAGSPLAPASFQAAVHDAVSRSLAPPRLPDDPRCRPIPRATPAAPTGPSVGPTPEGTVPLAELDRRNAVALRNIDAIVKNPLAAPISVGAFITGDQDHVARTLAAAQGPTGMVVGMGGVKGGMDRFEAANAEAGIQHRAKSSEVAGSGGGTSPKPDGKPAATATAGGPVTPPAAPPPATAAPAQPPSAFAALGTASGGPASDGVPWVDNGSVKPASPSWTANGGARAFTEHGKRIGQMANDRNQGVAFYDAEGNVFLIIKKVGGMQENVWSGVIGKVDISGLPGKFRNSEFGKEIEPLVNDLISRATRQSHNVKDGSTTGADYVPRVERGRHAND
jgi:RHS repeat-associated protein